MCCTRATYLIIVLWSLVLHEQLQAFFSNKRLLMTTSTVPFFRFIRIRFGTIFARFVCFTGHLGFAVSPYNGHTRFAIAHVSDFVGKICVGLRNTRRESR